MPKIALNDALGALHDALEGTDDLSVEERRSLLELHGEIELVLERTEEIHGDGGKQVQRGATNVVEEFESRHPALTSALSRVVNVLASLGI